MNPLLEQFLAEARELLEHSSDTFLQLEKSAEDAGILNSLFRYVHTIKGGSGLFDIAPFTQLVHVAEDSLSKARDGQLIITSQGIDLYLQILDQLHSWLNELEADGALGSQAQGVSDNLTAQIKSRILGLAAEQPAASVSNELHTTGLNLEACLQKLDVQIVDAEVKSALSAQLDCLTAPASLLVYQPQANAFFSGEDPVSFWSGVPDLLWQTVLSDFQHHTLEEFDPFDCRLTFVGLSTADDISLQQHLDYVWSNVRLVRVAGRNAGVTNAEPTAELQQVLRHQAQIVKHLQTNPQPDASLASVSRVLGCLATQYPALASLQQILATDGPTAEFISQLDALAADETIQDAPLLPAGAQRTTAMTVNEQPHESILLDETFRPQVKTEPSRVEAIRTIKVDQERLEQLVDLTGELIVAKNSLQHLARRVEQDYGIKALTRDIKTEHAVLNRITESLQDLVMQIRMIPVSTIFQRFPRLVRDLSRRLGKEIELQVTGEDTEADKNIVEQMADPLIHLVRNSIDHGIEMPDERQQKGKPAIGLIRLVAKNAEDFVQIEIHDDGGGIDPQIIKDKAIVKGVVSEELAQKMTEQEILQLIFEPGFSTREEVSELSGRGVGMDVVKTTVTRLGGSVDVQSQKNQGSVITVRLPASITVSRVMMFEVNEQVYGIPVEGLTETIKIKPEKIRGIKRGEAYVLRDQLIPLYRMHQLLGVRQLHQKQELPILNLNIGGTVAGFAVDRLLEGVDVIIKPLEGVMSRFPLYSGAAVLGDGRVLLVINPKELALCH